MRRRAVACLLTICASLFFLSSCQKSFEREERLSMQDIYRYQQEFGTAGGVTGESSLEWLALQDAVLLAKMTGWEDCYFVFTNQGDIEIKKERDYASSLFQYPGRIWTLRVLDVGAGALKGREKIIRVLDVSAAINGALEQTPAFELGQVFVCGVTNAPRVKNPLGQDWEMYMTFRTVTYRIVPGGYIFRCDPDAEDAMDGWRLDLFFYRVKQLRERVWLDVWMSQQG